MNRASRLSARAMPCHCAFSRMRRSLPARGLYNRRYGFAIILGLMAFANRARCLPQSAADSRSRKPRWMASRLRWLRTRPNGWIEGMTTGLLNLVSVGPGHCELIAPQAADALRNSDIIVGYSLYLRWVAPWIKGKHIHTLPLTQERTRADVALASARAGQRVALVSSGDIGVYAMAALLFEQTDEADTFDLRITPGITAANACASLLGSPLSHDFATLSLSDWLCPWQWIEHRARHIAQADLAVALYNATARSACAIWRARCSIHCQGHSQSDRLSVAKSCDSGEPSSDAQALAAVMPGVIRRSKVSASSICSKSSAAIA